MYRVYVNGKASVFEFLDVAIKFAKLSGVWYYIASDDGIIRTQDDDAIELLLGE
jgi:hypothetical protein